MCDVCVFVLCMFCLCVLFVLCVCVCVVRVCVVCVCACMCVFLSVDEVGKISKSGCEQLSSFNTHLQTKPQSVQSSKEMPFSNDNN